MAGGQVIVVPTDPWKNDQWSQNDTINDGYPYVTDAGVAEQYSAKHAGTVWGISASILYGYPHVKALYPSIPVEVETPHIKGFLLRGTGGKFRHIEEWTALAIPERIQKRYPEAGQLWFSFHVNREVIS